MEEFKNRVLQSLLEHSNPYVDIRDLQAEYDIDSDNFAAAFLELEQAGFIKSNSVSCGLKRVHGEMHWSIVELFVTESGKKYLAQLDNDSKNNDPTLARNWLVKPVLVEVVKWAVIGILGIIAVTFWNKLTS
ncbi:hypothetical protein CGT72_11180 [Vibrio cholerae]|uniref:hypothetical protein n=1 Tax=Vibrio TaxID=662 RepID=UPI0004E3B957|nr:MULTISPECIES: hypothetical protein [Vibrio]EJL6264508.1 hypothetical protein [Vibrio cholerae]EJL6442144.1 hypothetical protein [Vibrio cholerae]KFE25437.1 hypothetical protein DN30_3909 [Vibrio cholerae]KQB06056.1 hypothetical protein XV94_17495 [Vibrio metoecus]PAS33002.1 hypothetical protein CGT72_11180 [Vibrio cholerae]